MVRPQRAPAGTSSNRTCRKTTTGHNRPFLDDVDHDPVDVSMSELGSLHDQVTAVTYPCIRPWRSDPATFAA